MYITVYMHYLLYVTNASWTWKVIPGVKKQPCPTPSTVPSCCLCFHLSFSCPPILETQGSRGTAPIKLKFPHWDISFLYRYFSKTCCCERPKRMGHHKRSPQGEWSQESTPSLPRAIVHLPGFRALAVIVIHTPATLAPNCQSLPTPVRAGSRACLSLWRVSLRGLEKETVLFKQLIVLTQLNLTFLHFTDVSKSAQCPRY